MATMVECSICEHAQMVGMIANGLSAGFPDPQAVCENCGAVGKFLFAPGFRASLRAGLENAVCATCRLPTRDHLDQHPCPTPPEMVAAENEGYELLAQASADCMANTQEP